MKTRFNRTMPTATHLEMIPIIFKCVAAKILFHRG